MTDIDVLLLDLDGVVRHFDSDATSVIERDHGLPTGAILTAAFDHVLLRQVTCGEITRAQWVERVGVDLGSPEAARLWSQERPVVDDDVVLMAHRAREAGVRVCLLTNGTDTIDDELEHHRLTDVFDTVFNSAEIGHAKPDLEIFAHVVTTLDVSARRVLYFDDSPSHVRSAAALGIRAAHFTGVDDLRSALRAHGVSAV